MHIMGIKCDSIRPTAATAPDIQLEAAEWLKDHKEILSGNTAISGSHNTHSRLAPSASERWTTCTASVPYATANAHRIPEDKGSVYADEGTKAHDYAASVLLGAMDIDDVPESFRPHVKLYVDHCRSLERPDAETIVERSVPLFYRTSDTGTVDFAVVGDGLVVVRDLKYGQGVEVEAEGNTQLAIYALSLVYSVEGIYHLPPDTTVSIGVVQPRYRGSEPVKVWELTLAELEEFCSGIVTAVSAIDSGFTRFAPSEKACRWCKCKSFCEARFADAVAPFGDSIEAGLAALDGLPEFTKAELKLPVEERLNTSSVVTPDQMVAIWRKRKAITRMLDDIEEHLSNLAQAGTPAPGTKLVQGRPGNRKWLDEEEAEKVLRGRLKADERYVKVLISPTVAAEKLDLELANCTRFRNRFNAVVSRADGRPVLADESDKRPAIVGDLELLPDMEEDAP